MAHEFPAEPEVPNLSVIFEFIRKPDELLSEYADPRHLDVRYLARGLKQHTRLVIDGAVIFEMPASLLSLCFFGLLLGQTLESGIPAHLDLSEGPCRLLFDRHRGRGDGSGRRHWRESHGIALTTCGSLAHIRGRRTRVSGRAIPGSAGAFGNRWLVRALSWPSVVA